MNYQLYLGGQKVGTVVEQAKDFPSLWGHIDYDQSMFDPNTASEIRWARFIKLNCDSTRLSDMEDEKDVADELDALNKQLEEYLDYIETDDWVLVDDQDTRHLILCPILRHDGDIVWRWNPKG